MDFLEYLHYGDREKVYPHQSLQCYIYGVHLVKYGYRVQNLKVSQKETIPESYQFYLRLTMKFLSNKDHVLPESFNFKVAEIYKFFNCETEVWLEMFKWDKNFFLFKGREKTTKKNI